jgi:hypothetical protein
MQKFLQYHHPDWFTVLNESSYYYIAVKKIIYILHIQIVTLHLQDREIFKMWDMRILHESNVVIQHCPAWLAYHCNKYTWDSDQYDH